MRKKKFKVKKVLGLEINPNIVYLFQVDITNMESDSAEEYIAKIHQALRRNGIDKFIITSIDNGTGKITLVGEEKDGLLQ